MRPETGEDAEAKDDFLGKQFGVPGRVAGYLGVVYGAETGGVDGRGTSTKPRPKPAQKRPGKDFWFQSDGGGTGGWQSLDTHRWRGPERGGAGGHGLWTVRVSQPVV